MPFKKDNSWLFESNWYNIDEKCLDLNFNLISGWSLPAKRMIVGKDLKFFFDMQIDMTFAVKSGFTIKKSITNS